MCSTWVAMSLMRLGEASRWTSPTGRVADQDPEAVGRLLDVVEQRRGRPARAARAGGRRSAPRCIPSSSSWHLAVDDDRVEALLAAEVLVDDRLGDLGACARSPRSMCPRNPCSANSLRPTSMSCSRRSAPRHPAAGGLGSGLRRRLVTAAHRRSARRQAGRRRGDPLGRSSRSGGGQRTSLAQPSLSNTQMIRADESIWPRQHAVPGAGRVGVVQVVPRLAHRQDRQPPDVGGPVAGAERPLADGVADRVDRPGDVVQQARCGPASPRRTR